MNISPIITKSDGTVMAPMSMRVEAGGARRDRLEVGRQHASRRTAGRPACAGCSTRAPAAAPCRRRAGRPWRRARAACAPTASRLRRRRDSSSAHTKKPRPPAMMSDVMTRLTTTSPRHDIRLSLHSAKPALLKADTAWKRPYQAALPSPSVGRTTTAPRMSAPVSSKASVSFSTVPAKRTRPSMSCAFSASCSVMRSCSVTDAAERDDEHRAERHVAEAAGLDEQQDDDLAEDRQVDRRVDDDEAGDAHRRHRREERVEHRHRGGPRRPQIGSDEQHAAHGDDPEEAERRGTAKATAGAGGARGIVTHRRGSGPGARGSGRTCLLARCLAIPPSRCRSPQRAEVEVAAAERARRRL